MFIQNKYKKWYDSIIENANGRTVTGYFEIHHTLPRSLGGSDSEANLVKLTAKEHFICHLLLTKFTIGEAYFKMCKAADAMSILDRYGSRYKASVSTIAVLREKASKAHSALMKGKKKPAGFSAMRSEATKGNKNPMYGRRHTEEVKQAQRERAISQGFIGNRKGKVPINKGVPMSDAQKQKLSESRKLTPKITCHCGKEMSPHLFVRWHGDNCKIKGE